MNTLYVGSICLTDLIAQAKKGHSAFTKAQNGKVYFNTLTWVNDTPDKFGNTMSHQLSSIKEMRDKEEKVYIGNSKKLETNQPVSSNDVQDDSFDNVPVRQSKSSQQEEPADDLPF